MGTSSQAPPVLGRRPHGPRCAAAPGFQPQLLSEPRSPGIGTALPPWRIKQPSTRHPQSTHTRQRPPRLCEPLQGSRRDPGLRAAVLPPGTPGAPAWGGAGPGWFLPELRLREDPLSACPWPARRRSLACVPFSEGTKCSEMDCADGRTHLWTHQQNLWIRHLKRPSYVHATQSPTRQLLEKTTVASQGKDHGRVAGKAARWLPVSAPAGAHAPRVPWACVWVGLTREAGDAGEQAGRPPGRSTRPRHPSGGASGSRSSSAWGRGRPPLLTVRLGTSRRFLVCVSSWFCLSGELGRTKKVVIPMKIRVPSVQAVAGDAVGKRKVGSLEGSRHSAICQ